MLLTSSEVALDAPELALAPSAGAHVPEPALASSAEVVADNSASMLTQAAAPNGSEAGEMAVLNPASALAQATAPSSIQAAGAAVEDPNLPILRGQPFLAVHGGTNQVSLQVLEL